MQAVDSFSSFFTLFVLEKLLKIINSLSNRLTYRMRRTLFVYSVYKAMDIMNGLNKKIILDINGQLRLTDNTELCIASAVTGQSIWSCSNEDAIKGIRIEDLATNQLERDLVSNYFIRRCPRWLQYGSKDKHDMKRDLKRLFKVIITRNAY